jgi:hypothetical protein
MSSDLAITSSPTGTLDRTGIAVSTLCALHCALAPALLVAVPASVLPIVESPALEWGLIALAASVGLWAIARIGWGTHRRRHPVLLLATGLALLVASRFELVEEGLPEILLVAVGAAFVAGAHVRNLLCTRKCVACAAESKC